MGSGSTMAGSRRGVTVNDSTCGWVASWPLSLPHFTVPNPAWLEEQTTPSFGNMTTSCQWASLQSTPQMVTVGKLRYISQNEKRSKICLCLDCTNVPCLCCALVHAAPKTKISHWALNCILWGERTSAILLWLCQNSPYLLEIHAMTSWIKCCDVGDLLQNTLGVSWKVSPGGSGES